MYEDDLIDVKRRLESRRDAIDKWHRKVKDLNEPELVVSGTFTEIEKKRREKLGDDYDE